MDHVSHPRGPSSPATCQDPKRAFRWLEAAFGFAPSMALLDPAGHPAHAERGFGEHVLRAGGEWSENHASPAVPGGRNTRSVHLQLARGEGIDAHCARAREAGAKILQAPETQFYGDRTDRARDFEGHIWTFGVTVRDMTAVGRKPRGCVRLSGCRPSRRRRPVSD
ncbi:VOC family protein [Thermaurantiacus sp.]